VSAGVDLARLRRLAALPGAPGQTLAEELAAAFIAVGPETIADLRALATAGDAVTLQRRAHSLRGNSLMLGVDAFATLLDRLEASAEAGDAAAWPAQIAAVADAWPATAAALSAAVQHLPDASSEA
jgi:HPt (histidine-containing phosphotransfer) domain-containing protein